MSGPLTPLELSVRLLNCQADAKAALGDRYPQMVTKSQTFLREVAEPDETMLATATRIGRMGILDGPGTICLLAAACEPANPIAVSTPSSQSPSGTDGAPTPTD